MSIHGTYHLDPALHDAAESMASWPMTVTACAMVGATAFVMAYVTVFLSLPHSPRWLLLPLHSHSVDFLRVAALQRELTAHLTCLLLAHVHRATPAPAAHVQELHCKSAFVRSLTSLTSKK